MRYIRLTLEYDGTNFSGWQKQTGTGLRTVQGVLEKALEKLTGERIATCGAGRTDAGVHALGQVVSFGTEASIPVARFPAALNGVLPPDVVVKESEEVDASFHARYSAIAKQYRYLIWNGRLPSALWRNYSYHVPQPLDEKAMQDGACYFEGSHDFVAFSATGSSVKSTVRNLLSFQVSRCGDWVIMTVTAEGFLYKMVRLMAGTLVAVGLGRCAPAKVGEILAAKEKGRGGPALPPQGLCLMRIYYPGDDMGLQPDQPVATPVAYPFLSGDGL